MTAATLERSAAGAAQAKPAPRITVLGSAGFVGSALLGHLRGQGADCLAPLTFASHAYDDFHLLMPLYICRRWDGEVIAREGQQLAWVRANKLRDYPMPPADIPLIPHLIDLLM